MPVYEYRCTSCLKEFEIEHRMSEKRTECAECKGSLERLISRTSFAFKGGGWYKDLYASPKPGASSSDDGGSSSASSSSASSSSSTKAANDTASSSSSSSTSSSGTGGGGSTTSGVAAAS